MSEFKGTKGKWELESENPTSFPYVLLKNDTRILSINVILSSRERIRNNYKDGTFDFSDKGSISLSEENIANAKLIASAPEMLEMLKECKLQLEYLNEKFTETGTTNSLLSKIESLIKQATEL